MPRLKWWDQLGLLLVVLCLAYAGYNRYQYYHAPPVPPNLTEYRLDPLRRAELEQIASRLQVNPTTWSTLLILPHPRFQGPTQDAFLQCCESGELAPLIGRTRRETYVEGIHQVPEKWKPWLAKREKPEYALCVIFSGTQPVYWDLVPASDLVTPAGLNWVHHVVDDVITTFHRWMTQQ